MPVGDTKPRKFVGYGSAVLEIAAFPSSYVLPEVGVTEVTVYELAETDRRVSVDLELDIREAPLREWEMEISADHAVASVTGAQVADYAVAGEVKDGKRRLKIIFKQSVMNRQLVSVRLEKNEAAKAGPWNLQALGFPGAKSRRGYIGAVAAVAAAGYRLVAGKTAGVAEVPVTFFPKKVAGLQQAFRLREGDWQVGLTIEALGQSVQADVFHLYSLKAGAAYGSVLINYFVVGAPASEWRISVPDGIGNIEVTGQNVGRDWRREGNTVIVPLSSPVLGTGTVLLTFEQPMSARGGELTPGDVRPLDVQAERGYVQVVSPLQVKFPKPVSEGPLLAIDVSELPAEFRLLSTAPTLAAWQYTARDFKIGMKVEWFNPGETVEQAIDFLELTSKISRDGEWITDAGFFVKSRGRSALRTILPVGAALWEAKVNGQTVNARADGDATLIPLPLKTDPNEAVEVSLRYGARGAKATVVRLGAPRLEAPVVIGEWKVTGDEGRQLVPRGGTAELVGSGLAENGWKWLARNPRPAGGLLLVRHRRGVLRDLGDARSAAVPVAAVGVCFHHGCRRHRHLSRGLRLEGLGGSRICRAGDGGRKRCGGGDWQRGPVASANGVGDVARFRAWLDDRPPGVVYEGPLVEILRRCADRRVASFNSRWSPDLLWGRGTGRLDLVAAPDLPGNPGFAQARDRRGGSRTRHPSRLLVRYRPCRERSRGETGRVDDP
jgi:hypothetical protein